MAAARLAPPQAAAERVAPPAAGGPALLVATSANDDEDSGSDTPSNDPPPIEFKWPDESPPASAPTAQPSAAETGTGTLGTPDLGDGAPDAGSQPRDSLPSAEDDTTQPSVSNLGDTPPEIPATQPPTTPQVNAVLRSLAMWLARALAALGTTYELDPEVAAVLAMIEAAAWLADYLPKIFSYLDAPQTLADLQNAATRRAPPGYEIHHIVEAQKNSADPQSNALRFPDRTDSRANLVRVPYWKHVEISSWYSAKNERYGGLTPRQYLRGKTWDEQYLIGLQILRDTGVLK